MTHQTIAKLSLLAPLFFMVACGADISTPQQRAQAEAQHRADNAEVYIPKNNVELNNYNKRQQRADDPTTILWCTSAFPIPSSPLFTVPIVGKLTSGNKRPFPTSTIRFQEDYSPELAGPDHMYGTSGEYRYGFSPADVYSDFYNMPTYCTDQPMVWQREKTALIAAIDPALMKAQEAARQALKEQHPDEAQRILEEAVKQAGGR